MLLEDLNPDAETVAPLFPETEVIAFNYAALPPVDAAKVRKAADAIRARISSAQQGYFEAGRELASIKDAIPHGEFGKWLNIEFGMTERTAQNYMNAFRLWSENESVSVLPIKALYVLGSPTTPSEIRNRVFDQIKNGEVPSGQAVISEISNAKKKAAEEAKRAAAANRVKSEAERKAAERKEKASAAYKEKKAKREAEEKAERVRTELAEKQAAEKAVAMLRDKLGSDFPEFCELFALSSWRIGQLLKSLPIQDALAAMRQAAQAA